MLIKKDQHIKANIAFQTPANIDFTEEWATAKIRALCAIAEMGFQDHSANEGILKKQRLYNHQNTCIKMEWKYVRVTPTTSTLLIVLVDDTWDARQMLDHITVRIIHHQKTSKYHDAELDTNRCLHVMGNKLSGPD